VSVLSTAPFSAAKKKKLPFEGLRSISSRDRLFVEKNHPELNIAGLKIAGMIG